MPADQVPRLISEPRSDQERRLGARVGPPFTVAAAAAVNFDKHYCTTATAADGHATTRGLVAGACHKKLVRLHRLVGDGYLISDGCVVAAVIIMIPCCVRAQQPGVQPK